jgi:hypothetical protein
VRRAGAGVWVGTGVVLALLAGACGASDEEPPAREPVDTPEVTTPAPAAPDTDAGRVRCTNEEAGFSVAYPGDWQTNDGSVLATCSLFDPDPIEVPPASEIPEDIAVSISVEPVAFAQVVGGDIGVRVIENEDRTIAGRQAVAQLTESTGEGLLDQGVRAYRYLVDWGDGRTLFATSLDVGEPAFETKRRELDRMMETLRRE